MQLLLRDMPEVLDDSPHQEAAREEAIMLLRNVIALAVGLHHRIERQSPWFPFQVFGGRNGVDSEYAT